MKRTLKESPLQEFEGDKRLWLKVEDIDNNLYSQHYTPTEYNKEMKILSTEQYVPDFLKKLCVGSAGMIF